MICPLRDRGHSVNREVTAAQIFNEIGAVTDLRLARIWIVALGAKRRNLDNIRVIEQAHRPNRSLPTRQ